MGKNRTCVGREKSRKSREREKAERREREREPSFLAFTLLHNFGWDTKIIAHTHTHTVSVRTIRHVVLLTTTNREILLFDERDEIKGIRTSLATTKRFVI